MYTIWYILVLLILYFIYQQYIAIYVSLKYFCVPSKKKTLKAYYRWKLNNYYTYILRTVCVGYAY